MAALYVNLGWKKTFQSIEKIAVFRCIAYIVKEKINIYPRNCNVLIDFFSCRNVQTKSPTLGHSMNPVQFGDNINASLKVGFPTLFLHPRTVIYTSSFQNALGLLNSGMNSMNEKMIHNQNNNIPELRLELETTHQ